MVGHHFISYSPVDAEDFAIKLCDALSAGPPEIPAWLDKREVRAGIDDWDEQIAEAIRTCESLIFVMSPDSVESESVCKQEWTLALSYKKPVIPILLHPDAEMPFRLRSRQRIDFTGSFGVGLARLRNDLQYLASPEGKLQTLKYRLADAQRDLRRTRDPEQRRRIQDEIDTLREQIKHQQYVVENPQEAQKRVDESIERGLERERKPEKPVNSAARTKFINPPPTMVPRYFQDRHIETKLIGDFLKDDSVRMVTVVGRGGIGKTAMVCRLLKSLESGWLPDDGEQLSVHGIVYLSEAGSHRVNMRNTYADLCRLLPDNNAEELERIYKNPQASTEAKMYALLEAFQSGRYILLLDNFENVIDPETRAIRDPELDEALRAVMNLPQQVVKVIITTRFAPYELSLIRPERQARLDLDAGLPSPYAENILREMDVDGKVGLKTAPDELLDEARRRTGGNPRALEALFAILSADRSTSLREILDDTEKLPGNVVEVLVGEAFSRLDPVAQMVMQALAVYAHPAPPAAVDYLLKPHLAGVNSTPVLDRLVNMQFARKEAGHYYLHQVDQAYALSHVPRGEVVDREVIDAPPFTQFALLYRAANYFEQIRTPRETWKTIDDLAAQLAEFDLRCTGQDYDKAASVLLEIDLDYLLLWGYSRLAIELHERLQGKLSNLQLKQNSVGNLGSAYCSMGGYQRAKTCYEQALEIARKVRDRRNEGVWLGCLGNCYYDLGQTKRVIDHYKQALEIAREVGDQRNEGVWLGCLGNCYYDLGQTKRAIDHYEQALEIAREIGWQSGEAWLGKLGECYATLGQTKRAKECYEQALKIARETRFRGGEGWCLGKLGECYATLGQTEWAMNYYDQALEIVREIGNRVGEGWCLGKLGECYATLGQTERAMNHYGQALEIARETDFQSGEAWLGKVGECYATLGQTEQGKESYEQAPEIVREIGNRAGESWCLGKLGECHTALGQTKRAKECYEQALKIAREIRNRAGEGWCLGKLGQCHYNLGQTERAMDHYQQALIIACEMGHRIMESDNLTSIGYVLTREGELGKAAQQYEETIRIADEIGYSEVQSEARFGLARAHLYAGDLTAACAAAEAARQYNFPRNNANLLALLGVISVRQGDYTAAQEAFETAVAQAEELLSYSEKNYAALDSKGLALSGLALCEENNDHIPAAIDAYRAARMINKDVGIVGDVLRLLDELAREDSSGMLAEVRMVAAGEKAEG